MANVANLILTRADLFPVGTKVKAFTVPATVAGEIQKQVGSPATWRPPLAQFTEATVDANSNLELIALESGQRYLLWAEVNGRDVYLTVVGTIVEPEASGSSTAKVYNGQNTGAGEGALEAFAALPAVDRSVHTGNTALGWNALKALTGLTGVFPLTAGTIVGGTVLNLTGVEGKAGGIWAGGTSNTPMIVFRKLTPGQTGLKENTAYFLVNGTANGFSVALAKGGAAIAVAGAALGVDTEVALLRSAEDNTAIGSQAGKSLTTGGGNTLVGENAGVNLTTGEENTVVGCEALAAQQTQNTNVAIGFRALNQNTAGGNTALGTAAMEANTVTGESTALGFKAMQNAKSAKSVGVGFETLKNVTGKGNTALGTGAGKALLGGEENVLMGVFAGNSLTTGESNTALGTEALSANKTGKGNVAIGLFAGKSALGNGNIFLGTQAGEAEAGSNKLYIDNSNTATPLILGDFGTSSLTLSRAAGKVGFYGVAPVGRHAAIASPAAELAALKTAVDALRTTLTSIGITE